LLLSVRYACRFFFLLWQSVAATGINTNSVEILNATTQVILITDAMKTKNQTPGDETWRDVVFILAMIIVFAVAIYFSNNLNT